MKNTRALLTAFLLTPLLFTACKKDGCDSVFNARFYTADSTEKIFLYIDDAPRGELPYFAEAPVCGQAPSDGVTPLTAQLKSGEYRIAGKNEQGATVSSGTIRLSKRTVGTSGGIGGLRLDNNGDCVAVGLSQ